MDNTTLVRIAGGVLLAAVIIQLVSRSYRRLASNKLPSHDYMRNRRHVRGNWQRRDAPGLRFTSSDNPPF